MKLQFKIFLFAATLVLVIILSSFYFLNLRFSRVIKETINKHLDETNAVFLELINNRQDLLFFRGQNIAESPKLKASISETGADERTLQDQLLEFSATSEDVELYVITDPNSGIITCLLEGKAVPKDSIFAIIEEKIAQMQGPSDVWLLFDELYQIAVVPIRSGSKIHGYLLLGDRVDNEFAFLLKKITDSDVTFVSGTTISGSTLIGNELAGGIDLINSIRSLSGQPGSVVELNTMNISGNEHLIRLSDFPGNTGVQYLLSRPEESETEVLDALRFVLILLGAVSVIAVFVLSYFMASKLTRPLKELIEGTEDIASGNYERIILSAKKESHTNDEISYLARSFEKMRCAVSDNIGKITDLNKELTGKNKELENALEQLKEAQNELIKSERMSTVGKMASSIIHDFKSPMQVIKGMSQLIAMPDIDESKRNDLVIHISTAIDQMNNMTHDILDFVRGETNLNLENVKLSRVINEMILYMANDLKESGFKVTCNINYDPVVNIDIFKIKRVLENIIRNSIEAAKEGAVMEISTVKANGVVRIRVCDEGPGIPSDIVNSIFEPFVTKGKPGGTGLGLAISKKLIEDHKGSITVKSEEGEGTTFVIELPCIKLR